VKGWLLFTGKAANTNCIVFYLTWPDLEPRIWRTRGRHINNYSINTALIVSKILLLMFSYVSNVSFVLISIFIMADSMTEIRGDMFTSSVYVCGSSWSVYLLLLCLCFVFCIPSFFLYILSTDIWYFMFVIKSSF
jgi:hypothetical protein